MPFKNYRSGLAQRLLSAARAIDGMRKVGQRHKRAAVIRLVAGVRSEFYVEISVANLHLIAKILRESSNVNEHKSREIHRLRRELDKANEELLHLQIDIDLYGGA